MLKCLLLLFIGGGLWVEGKPLPEDLMVGGKPIHPEYIESTQFGDSSRLEKMPARSDVDSYEESFLHEMGRELYYDEEAGEVSFVLRYCRDQDIDSGCTYELYRSYEYLGSYEGKHLVLCDSGDTSATGRFVFLGLVRRCGDFIVHAGDVFAGDRSFIRVESFEDGVLRYWHSADPSEVITALGGEYIGRGYPPQRNEMGLVYEVDLTGEMEGIGYSSKLVGVDFGGGEVVPARNLKQ